MSFPGFCHELLRFVDSIQDITRDPGAECPRRFERTKFESICHHFVLTMQSAGIPNRAAGY